MLTVFQRSGNVRHVFDPITLDQLRAFVTIVEQGSFSAAARKLQRAQSAISKSMANLEEQLGVLLLDRSTKKAAKLSDAGSVVLAAARRVLLEMDQLKRTSAGMIHGIEPSVSLCVDALFPPPVLVELCVGFARAMPTVDLKLDTQFMSAVSARVMTGDATLGIVASGGVVPSLAKTPLTTIQMLPVVGAGHPFSKLEGQIPLVQLARDVQIVLSERHETGVPDRGVLSPRTWRVADLSTKHAMLRANLGWGNLPEHLAREDLRAGRLAAIHPESWSMEDGNVTLYAVHRNETTFGPAHRWLVDSLIALCAREGGVAPPRSRSRKVRD
ncbi:MAG TPA: LysR family transcriptional regulator [Kofleriaceae bacterium]|nr:LysR family transcriptional regulator [Kofleriaceae bacterium]